MKKIFTFLALALIVVACSTEEANINQFESQDISKMSETDFIDFMQTVAINRGALPSALNPDESVYPFPIESITSYGEEKNLIVDQTLGSCLEKQIELPTTGRIGKLDVARKSANDDNSVNNNLKKVDFEYTAEPGWFIYSIAMSVVDDCSSTPLTSAGTPDLTNFNIRNCFSGKRTKVKYRFAENCIPECSCIAAYVVLYTVDEYGAVDQCVGAWVDGQQIGASDGRSNEFCQDQCGVPQDN